MLIGYNTNGFAHHRIEDALAILAELGYKSIALTLDHYVLNPYSETLDRELEALRALLEEKSLRCVIETGSRFLLDPRRKHQPTLVSTTAHERSRRIDFLCRSIEIAARLNADAVSFWSGRGVDDVPYREHFHRLVDGCKHLSGVAAARDVRLAFEPEPGMLIDTMSKFGELVDAVGQDNFGLTLDIGHLHCQGETPIADHIHSWADRLWNVHIEDMRAGVHDHLMFGDGEIDFAPVLQALTDIKYAGGLHVELSRHSHDAVETARRATEFLRDKING